MIFTSYFGHIKKINPNYPLYSITAYKPKFFIGNHLSIVSPNPLLVTYYKHFKITKEKYEEIYLNYLNTNKEDIIKEINNLPPNSVLLCYEKNGKFCHRHILSKWLRSNNVDCEEIE